MHLPPGLTSLETLGAHRPTRRRRQIWRGNPWLPGQSLARWSQRAKRGHKLATKHGVKTLMFTEIADLAPPPKHDYRVLQVREFLWLCQISLDLTYVIYWGDPCWLLVCFCMFLWGICRNFKKQQRNFIQNEWFNMINDLYIIMPGSSSLL